MVKCMARATKRSRAIEALEALQNRYGQLAPEAVVEAARDPASPLHGYFLWDDEAAGHEFRMEQARQLIRSVTVRLTIKHRTIDPSRYIHDQRVKPRESVYVDIQYVTAESLVNKTLSAELDRIQGVVARAIRIAQALDKEKEFRALLKKVLR
jgi:hypothetical protein